MPSQKRQRQRAGRQAARQAAREAQRRTARRRRAVSIIVLVALVAGVALLLSRGEGEQEVEAGRGTTTTARPADADPFASLQAGGAPCPAADGSSDRRIAFDGPPRKCIDLDKTYKATIETDVGTFTVDLETRKAPVTVNNFVFLARYHFYEGVPFHRVVPGFVVQGGDAEKGDGTGGPGYTIPEEPPEAGQYRIGSMAMAKTAQPNSTGSQFFVITGEQGTGLPPQYSLFGTVTEGLDVVKKIEADGAPDPNPPKVVHRMTRVGIIEI
jgi:cyclophilin family peptidyl-prolyl cis-trans isomerase